MWFFYALIFAFLTSVGTIIAKKVMKDMDEYSYVFVSGLFSLPALLFVILLFYQLPKVDSTFYFAIAGSVMLDFGAAVLAYRAIRISEISLISPISAFNPVFTAIISFAFLREAITPKGWIGIILVVAGAYLLRASDAKRGIWQPIKSLVAHKGVQMSLVAYFIWSVTPILQKTAIFHTSPQVPPFASLAGMLGVTLLFVPKVIRKSRNVKRNVIKFLPLFILIAIITAVSQTAAFTVFSLTKLGLATAVFKVSVIFTVILGWLFFKEKNIKERLLGSIIMLLGVTLLVI